MTTSDNQLPEILQPDGDLCIPVSVPRDTEWLWLLAKCLSFPTAKRFWRKGQLEADVATVMAEWDSRVYNPVVEKIINSELCAEAGEDDCLEFPPNHGMIDWLPMNPFSGPGTVPPGYLLSPWVRYADLLFEDLPDWLADLIAEITGEFTGYQPDDVLSLIGSFPLSGDWEGALTSGLPRFTVEVSGKGTLELHFVTVPFGGRAVISVDVEPNIGDILTGIFAGDIQIYELERDFSSVPPELNVEQIHEVKIETTGDHVIHVTLLPVVDVALIPLRFGGGLRSVVWCSDNIPEPEPCPDCDLETVLEDDEQFEEYVEIVFGDKWQAAQDKNEALQTAYDGNATSIGSSIPTGTPNDEEKNALCSALIKFVKLYCSEKVCMIQSRNGLQIAWDAINNAAEAFYSNVLEGMLGAIGDELFGCIVDVETALDVLVDESAQEDLACHLFEELESGSISESAFTNAIDDAAGSLGGNAGLIACVMTEDVSQVVYLNFLQAYNQELLNQADGNVGDCPCITQSYRLWRWNFATQGLSDWVVVWVGSEPQAVAESGYVTHYNGFGQELGNIEIRYPHIDPSWRIKGARLQYQRSTGGFLNMRYRPNFNSNTSALNPSISNGLVTGSLQWACQNIPLTPAPGYMTGIKEFYLVHNTAGGSAPFVARIYQLEILYLDGFAPADSIPWSDADLCT